MILTKFFIAKLFHCVSVTFMMITPLIINKLKGETFFVPYLNQSVGRKTAEVIALPSHKKGKFHGEHVPNFLSVRGVFRSDSLGTCTDAQS